MAFWDVVQVNVYELMSHHKIFWNCSLVEDGHMLQSEHVEKGIYDLFRLW